MDPTNSSVQGHRDGNVMAPDKDDSPVRDHGGGGDDNVMAPDKDDPSVRENGGGDDGNVMAPTCPQNTLLCVSIRGRRHSGGGCGLVVLERDISRLKLRRIPPLLHRQRRWA